MEFKTPDRDTLVLYASSFLMIAFMLTGIFNILDYLIVKIILFSGVATIFLLVITEVISKYSEKEKTTNNTVDGRSY